MDSPSTLAIVLAAVPATLAAVASFIASLRNRRHIREVKIAVDGRMEELLRLTRTAYFARGVKAEIDSPTSPPISGKPAPETLGNSVEDPTKKSPDNGAT